MAAPRGSDQHAEVWRDPTHPKSLADLGISRDQSSIRDGVREYR
jgi:hypothetical protein